MDGGANLSHPRNWDRLLETGSKEPGWDLLIVGGGITGAGLLREASLAGLKVALIEQRDFAWGTSSRSSKMIHGGLRYLASGDLQFSRVSIRERNRLLREFQGLVNPLGFLFSHYRHKLPGPWSFNALLSLYDLLGGKWDHRRYPVPEFLLLAPHIMEQGLKGGTHFIDAVTDDARLVFRLIQDASLRGALSLNYVKVLGLIKKDKRVCGVRLRDSCTKEQAQVFARTVVNATGAWADRLRQEAGGGADIRPLRGSHLVFPFWRLPVAQAIALMHPRDRRPVFILPWEGATVVGTTDLDHTQDLSLEPRITPEEIDYLMEVVHSQFPSLALKKSDAISTYSGIRPVIHRKRRARIAPSKERRDHSVWLENGLLSVGGGKLTTFRLIARDTLRRLPLLIPSARSGYRMEALAPGGSAGLHGIAALTPWLQRRLSGRYGSLGSQLLRCASPEELERIPGTDTLWAELRWGAKWEAVVHLEDLLLRRTRLGVVLKEGGLHHLDRLKTICFEELGWSPAKWEEEVSSYRRLWSECYAPPEYPVSS